VTVWCCDLDTKSGDSDDTSCLASAELEQASSFRAERDRMRFVRRRVALRKLLAAPLDVEPARVAYRSSPSGKPLLADQFTGSGIVFNASHAGALGLIAIGRATRIGIDVEKRRNDPSLLSRAAEFFSANEVSALRAMVSQHRIDAFFRCWTRKEAVLKGVGGGLSLPLSSFDVTLSASDAPEITRWQVPGEPGAAWTLHQLELASGYFAALAVDGVPANIDVRVWPA
jgi:4'-phosphopantetheinyl transferase